MRVLKIILIVLMFCCLVAGFVLVLGAKMFTRKEANSRKELKLKIIGYIVFLGAFALALFQSLISF